MFARKLRKWMKEFPYGGSDCPGAMDEYAWARSSIEFLPQVVYRDTDPLRYAGVLQDVADEAARSDAWCRNQLAIGGIGPPEPPPFGVACWWDSIDAVPEPHWWWRVTAAPGYYDDHNDDSFSDSDTDSESDGAW